MLALRKKHWAVCSGPANIYLWCWETFITYPRGLLMALLCDISCAYPYLHWNVRVANSSSQKWGNAKTHEILPHLLMLGVMLSFTAYTSTNALISSSYANCFKKPKSLVCNLKWDPDALIILGEKKKKALSGNFFCVTWHVSKLNLHIKINLMSSLFWTYSQMSCLSSVEFKCFVTKLYKTYFKKNSNSN